MFIIQFLSVCMSVQVISICLCAGILSGTRGWLHRLRSDPLVPGPWAAGRGHSVRASCGRVGSGLRLRWVAPRESTLAREVWRRSALPHPKNSRYPDKEPHQWVLKWKKKSPSGSTCTNLDNLKITYTDRIWQFPQSADGCNSSSVFKLMLKSHIFYQTILWVVCFALTPQTVPTDPFTKIPPIHQVKILIISYLRWPDPSSSAGVPLQRFLQWSQYSWTWHNGTNPLTIDEEYVLNGETMKCVWCYYFPFYFRS